MTAARRLAVLVCIGVAVLTLSIIVLARTRNVDEHLLAIVGLLGGLAIVVVSLPTDSNHGGTK
jgi:hypothetical protein